MPKSAGCGDSSRSSRSYPTLRSDSYLCTSSLAGGRGLWHRSLRTAVCRQGYRPDAGRRPDAASVHVDADRVIQVLINLLGNMLRYTIEGAAMTVHAVHQGDSMVFSVVGKGIGITQEHLLHVFERFYERI
jgi:signal transduction histidine kinase